ncbi:spore coat protein [Virgibacillus sp. W0181]|uniref:spore coat protein n=1 Tax=Virgibacillus sp. W0181 TaxID=3391581 RepID=UPI003F474AEE
MRHHQKPHWNCQKPVKEIVYPVKENMVHCCSEETVKHVHPTHTTVMNHHLIKNEHVYPQTTSYGNTVNEVNVNGAPGPGGQVAGAMSPGMTGMGPNGQVAGAMSPGHSGMAPGGQGHGAMGHHGMMGKHHCKHQPPKWC